MILPFPRIGVRVDPLWSVTGLSSLAVLIAGASGGFRIDPAHAAQPVLATGLLAAVSCAYMTIRPAPRIGATTKALAILIAFSAVAAAMSYVIAAADVPLRDAQLLAADRAIGFDWHGYLAVVNAWPALGGLLKLAYDTLLFQLILVILALGFTGRIAALDRFTWSYIVAGTACVAISGLMPAVGNYVYQMVPAHEYAALHPSAAFVHMADVEALRDGSLRLLRIDRLEGIITFPSFHAVLAVLVGWALWQVPAFRWPGVAWEGLMLAATPIHGAHYLVDVIAGAGLAVLALALPYPRVRSFVPTERIKDRELAAGTVQTIAMPPLT